MTDTPCLAAAGTTPGAERFITETPSTAAEASAAEAYAAERMVRAVELLVRAAGSQRPGLSTETGRRLEDTLRPRGQSGTRSGAFSGYDHGGQTRSYSSRGSASFGGGERVAAAGFTVAEAGMAAVAGIGNRSFVMFQVV